MQPKAMIVALSIFLNVSAAAVIGHCPLAEKIELVLDAEKPERTKAHRKKEHDADEGRLQYGIHVEHEQQVAHGAHDEGPENRADGASRSTEQRCASDHHRRDRIERVVG